MKRSSRFPYPLPSTVPIHDGNGKYPERVRVSFSDGHVRNYVEQIQQPEPVLFTDVETRRMYRINGGYQNKEKPVEDTERRKTINRLKKMVIRREQELEAAQTELNGMKLELRNALTDLCGMCPMRGCKECSKCHWTGVREVLRNDSGRA